MKLTLIIASAIALGTVLAASRPQRRLLIAGDSTAQTYDTVKTLQRGWGQMVGAHLGDGYEVINCAIGGRSTKSFIAEERWQRLLDRTQPGDIVAIQFGHNDASTKPERHASYDDYRANLLRMIADVRAAKAQPVLLTSVVMRTFVSGNLTDDRLRAYPAIMRQVARQQQVPLIDVNVMTRDTVLLLGDEASKQLYMWIEAGVDSTYPDGKQDDTHLRAAGADAVAQYVARCLKQQFE